MLRWSGKSARPLHGRLISNQSPILIPSAPITPNLHSLSSKTVAGSSTQNIVQSFNSPLCTPHGIQTCTQRTIDLPPYLLHLSYLPSALYNQFVLKILQRAASLPTQPRFCPHTILENSYLRLLLQSNDRAPTNIHRRASRKRASASNAC